MDQRQEEALSAAFSKRSWEEAYELLDRSIRENPDNGNYRAKLAIVQNGLYLAFHKKIEDKSQVSLNPAKEGTPDSAQIDPHAGFLMSLLATPLTIEDLLAISGMDTFDALKTLLKLTRLGWVVFI